MWKNYSENPSKNNNKYYHKWRYAFIWLFQISFYGIEKFHILMINSSFQLAGTEKKMNEF